MSQCELCSSGSGVSTYIVSPESSFQNTLQACDVCRAQIDGEEDVDPKHWRGLQETIWSENPAVKVLAWRMLRKLTSEMWAQDLLEQLYLEDDLLEWAKAGESQSDESSESSSGGITRDSNGTVLAEGDSVTLIKDLDVKGAGFTAKRGTVVKKIALTDDPGLVEGKVNGVQIVLKTMFLKKA